MALEILSVIIFSFVTSFREILEAALIIGIILGYLNIIDRNDLRKDVLLGVMTAILFSILIALLFVLISNEFGIYQQLFEAGIMFIAAGIITWVVLWLNKQKHSIRAEIETEMSRVISSSQRMGLFLLVFFSVAREGAEMVLLLYSSYIGFVNETGFVVTITSLSVGFILGLASTIFVSLVMYKTSYKFEIKKFFTVTSVILIIFAAGLIAHGLHEIYEFLEAYNYSLTLNIVWIEVWDVNNTLIGDILKMLFGWGYDPLFPNRFEKSIIGTVMVGLFGWNDNPSLVEVVMYVVYWSFIILWSRKVNKKYDNKVTQFDDHTEDKK